MLAQQVLADHVAVAAVLPKALRQPFLQTAETPLTLRWSNRCPTARPQITSYRIPAAPHLAGYPLAPPTQFVQVHHRRHLVRRQHPFPPRIQPPRRALPQHHSRHSSSFRRGSVLMSSGGQFFMSPDSCCHRLHALMNPSERTALSLGWGRYAGEWFLD